MKKLLFGILIIVLGIGICTVGDDDLDIVGQTITVPEEFITADLSNIDATYLTAGSDSTLTKTLDTSHYLDYSRSYSNADSISFNFGNNFYEIRSTPLVQTCEYCGLTWSAWDKDQPTGHWVVLPAGKGEVYETCTTEMARILRNTTKGTTHEIPEKSEE